MQVFISVLMLLLPMMKAEASGIEKLIVSEGNQAFHHVQVVGNNGTYVVTGEVRSAVGEYYYTVEDGHREIIKEQRVVVKKGDKWKPFTLNVNVPPEAIPDNGTLLLNLYQKNSKGEISNTYPVVLERRF
jgi:hypothetical protein